MGLVQLLVLALAVLSLGLSAYALRRDAPLDWRFAVPVPDAPQGAPQFETVLDYARDDLEEAVLEASDGGVDVILDHRFDEYLPFDARVAAQDGRIAVIGNRDLRATHDNVPRCRGKSLSFHHVSMFNTPDFGDVLSSLATLLADGELTTEVARTYSLDDLPDAHRDVMAESYFGKLVVVP